MIFNSKRSLRLMALALATAIPAAMFTGCSDDDDGNSDNTSIYKDTEVLDINRETGVGYDSDNVWTSWSQNTNLQIDDYLFSHQFTSYTYDGITYGVSSGFVPARQTDTAEYPDMTAHQFSVITGGGVSGKGTPYITAYWDTTEETSFNARSCRVFEEEEELFVPQYVYVTNTCYAYYAMLNGNNFCRKFAKGDWLLLVAHGVKQDGSEITTSIRLADITTDDVKAGIIDTWTKFDLTGLGVVRGIYFTMESSDSGQFGMNTPSYFAIDKLTVKE